MIHILSFFFLSADTALWISCGCAVIGLFSPLDDMSAAVPLIGLGGLLGSFLSEKHPRLRWLGILPAAAAAALCRSIPDALLVMPPAVYLTVCILKERTMPVYNELYYRFTVSMLAAAAGGIQ